MSLTEYARSFDTQVSAVLAPAGRVVPALVERLQTSGMEPDDLVDAASLRRLPVLTKDELLDLQAKEPPFGGFLAPGARLRRVFQSPGPLYEPEPDIDDHWRVAPALRVAGFDDSDIVLNAFGYHLSPAGVMFEEAARVLGCQVIPAGVGNMELQVRAARDLGATAFCGVPSYLKALLERADKLDGRPLRLARAVVGAEPLPPSLREWLAERVPVVRQMYGTAETGLLGYECEEVSGWHVPGDALVEVCSLDDDQPLPAGEEGQVVVTLFSEHYPLVRFGTGDLSAFVDGECGCGIPSPRLVGWLGRVGEAVKVRGMFLHPRQVTQVMSKVTGVEAYRFLVDRVNHRDVLRCEIVLAAGAGDSTAAAVRDAVRSGLRFDTEVVTVPAIDPDSKPVTDIRTWD